MSEMAFKPGSSVIPIARDTLQERVYNQICDLILDGEIAPGQLVTVQSLAGAFGVSAMPVREAMRRLTAAGALTLISGRSVGIPGLSRERLLDLREVRLQVEGTAAAWAAARLAAADLARLRHELERMQRAADHGDVKEYLRGNRRFHFTIYEAAGSPTLLEIIKSLWLQISPYFNLLQKSGNFDTSNMRHEAILTALAARQPDDARDALRQDIGEACAVLLGALP